jgi:hypothetical protein
MRRTLHVLTIALCTFACTSEDDLSETSTTFGESSSSSGSGSSDTTSSIIEAAPERTSAPSCAAPEDVPPSLPGIDLEAELDPLASTTCPTSWCVETISCGQCCNGEYPTLGTTECCVMFGNQRWPSSTGTCGGSGLKMKCEYDLPSPDGKPRRTPVPTACPQGGGDWTCPNGTHPEPAQPLTCSACSVGLGQPCGFNNTCSLCEFQP